MRLRFALAALWLLSSAGPLFALTPGTDVLIPAAARGVGLQGSMWVTDLCLFNPGSLTATGTIAWMARNAANTSPQTVGFSLGAEETLYLEDVILGEMGLSVGVGAFRITADRPVAATTRIYNVKNGATLGQALEGVPRPNALPAGGGSAHVVGLTSNAAFRTNVILMDASGSGSTVALTLLDENGSELGSRTYTLRAFEPRLFPVSELGAGSFEVATLQASVVSGSVIVVGSKIDNDPATGDPMTLAPVMGGTAEGTYQFALYDSASYASGGSIVVGGDDIVTLRGSYANFDKLDAQRLPACPLIFAFGANLPAATTIADLSAGVSFTDAFSGSGRITFTVQATAANNLSFSGTVVAEGAGFASDPDPSKDESGCNGTFPPLTLLAGKTAQ